MTAGGSRLLREGDPGEDDAATDQLDRPERLAQPSPGDDGGDDGSHMPTAPTMVGGTCRSAARFREYGASVPSTITQATPIHTGTATSSRTPSSEVVMANSAESNDHHGRATAQNSAPKANM